MLSILGVKTIAKKVYTKVLLCGSMVFNNILGVFYMANGLEHIAQILKELNEELKLDNDKWEKANEPTTTLRSGDDATTSKGEQDEHTQ